MEVLRALARREQQAQNHHYDIPARVTILFDGSKSFWKSNCKVDVIVALHDAFKVIEVICYDPDRGLEAPRIYLNLDIVKAR